MTTTVNHLLRQPDLDRVDARVLLQHVLGVNRAWLVGHGEDTVSTEATSRFHALCARRLTGEPVAYLVGEREFWGRPFMVTPDVLIPRPETELLIETALARLPPDKPLRVLDIGTGSGCIAITLKLEAPRWEVYALDISAAALAIASENAKRLSANVHFIENDLLHDLDQRLNSPTFDLIISNPPYIPEGDPHLSQGDLRFEPTQALTDFGDGLKCYRHIASRAKHHLQPDGLILLEHGFDQGEQVPQVFTDQGWLATDLSDYAGNPRICIAHRSDS